MLPNGLLGVVVTVVSAALIVVNLVLIARKEYARGIREGARRIDALWVHLDLLVARGARVSVHNRAGGVWACHIVIKVGMMYERATLEFAETREGAIREALSRIAELEAADA